MRLGRIEQLVRLWRIQVTNSFKNYESKSYRIPVKKSKELDGDLIPVLKYRTGVKPSGYLTGAYFTGA